MVSVRFDIKIEVPALTLENIQANTTQFVNVGVVDLGEESNLWRGHRVIIWEEKFELEYTTYIYVRKVIASWGL